jgi:hypothetical protein
MLFDNVKKIRWCPTMHEQHVVVDEETLVPRVLVNNLKRPSTAPVSLLGKTTDPKSSSPRYRWKCLGATEVWGLSSTQTWVL